MNNYYSSWWFVLTHLKKNWTNWILSPKFFGVNNNTKTSLKAQLLSHEWIELHEAQKVSGKKRPTDNVFLVRLKMGVKKWNMESRQPPKNHGCKRSYYVIQKGCEMPAFVGVTNPLPNIKIIRKKEALEVKSTDINKNKTSSESWNCISNYIIA